MPPIQVHIANGWTEVIAPAGAIIGVILGGVLVWGREQRLTKRALRHACRLLYMEMLIVEVGLEASRKKQGSQLQTDVQALISTWEPHHEALASMGFLDWNQVHGTVLGLRKYEQAGQMPPPGPGLDGLIREVVSSRKVFQRHVAGPLEYPRVVVWRLKQARAAQE
jgi:hypothetical protein